MSGAADSDCVGSAVVVRSATAPPVHVKRAVFGEVLSMGMTCALFVYVYYAFKDDPLGVLQSMIVRRGFIGMWVFLDVATAAAAFSTQHCAPVVLAYVAYIIVSAALRVDALLGLWGVCGELAGMVALFDVCALQSMLVVYIWFHAHPTAVDGYLALDMMPLCFNFYVFIAFFVQNFIDARAACSGTCHATGTVYALFFVVSAALFYDFFAGFVKVFVELEYAGWTAHPRWNRANERVACVARVANYCTSVSGFLLVSCKLIFSGNPEVAAGDAPARAVHLAPSSMVLRRPDAAAAAAARAPAVPGVRHAKLKAMLRAFGGAGAGNAGP